MWKSEKHRWSGLMMLILVLISMTACGTEKEVVADTQPDEYAVYEAQRAEVTEPETLPPVQITMPDYEMTYAGELKDVIVTEELSDGTGLKFSVKLSDREAHIFTLHYNSQEGELVTMLTDGKGNQIPIAFDMPAIPEGLKDADKQTFCLAQEAVNDIVDSLILK